MDVVDVWTGGRANALRTALRLTIEGFAHELGTAVRTVAKWSKEPNVVPVTELQRALDTALSRAPEDVKQRFAVLAGNPTGSDTVAVASPSAGAGAPHGSWLAESAADLRLSHDPTVSQMLSWLGARADWPNGVARERTAQYLGSIDTKWLHDRSERRSRVDRAAVAETLSHYYGDTSPYATYRLTCASRGVNTSLLTRPDWLDLQLRLGEGNDRLSLVPTEHPTIVELNVLCAQAAARRLAEVLASETRLINAPLYRLKRLDIRKGGFSGELDLTEFVTYALTLDLLENELVDLIADRKPLGAEALPLRRAYLPTVESVVDVGSRLCVGGPVALLAAARARHQTRDERDDYVLLVQERSGTVLNAGHRLAVIPKAFHQPLIDFSDDSQLSATLQRELEEELFGRTDVDSTTGGSRHADPLHLNRLSAPMRWLIDNFGAWRMECTGFGLNLVSGNFEFAGLIVIDDDEWWSRFGGDIEANWETDRLRRYSSMDREIIAHLVHDASWSNEGLFAFLQGLRRLAEIDPARVNLPPMELEI